MSGNMSRDGQNERKREQMSEGEQKGVEETIHSIEKGTKYA